MSYSSAAPAKTAPKIYVEATEDMDPQSLSLTLEVSSGRPGKQYIFNKNKHKVVEIKDQVLGFNPTGLCYMKILAGKESEVEKELESVVPPNNANLRDWLEELLKGMEAGKLLSEPF